MTRFQFNLEPALRVRRRLEERAEGEFAARQRELAAETEAAAALCRELEAARDRRAALLAAPDPAILAGADAYEESLCRAIAAQEERVAAAAGARDAARERLGRCRIDREVLEHLREARLQEHNRALRHAEQQQLDEIAVSLRRHGERSRSPGKERKPG